jgi:ribokinase
MVDVITIGSALVDIFISTPSLEVQASSAVKKISLEYGSKTEVQDFKVLTGGGGTNTAVGFARLGFSSATICETGKDNLSYLIEQDLTANGVKTGLIIKEKLEKTGGSVILVSSTGERSALIHRGAAAMLDPYDIPSYWLSQAKQIHLCSIGGQVETLNKIFDIINKNNQTKLSWNPGKKELALLVSRQLDISQIPCEILLVNAEEWDILSPVQPEILKKIPYTVVTAGKQGGTIYDHNKQQFHFAATSDKAIDATGAGDAFGTGFVAAMLINKTPQQAAQWGAYNAANVVKFYGAKTGLLHRQQLEQLLQ